METEPVEVELNTNGSSYRARLYPNERRRFEDGLIEDIRVRFDLPGAQS